MVFFCFPARVNFVANLVLPVIHFLAVLVISFAIGPKVYEVVDLVRGEGGSVGVYFKAFLSSIARPRPYPQ